MYDPVAWARGTYYWLEFPVDPPMIAQHFGIKKDQFDSEPYYNCLELGEVEVMGSTYSVQ